MYPQREIFPLCVIIILPMRYYSRKRLRGWLFFFFLNVKNISAGWSPALFLPSLSFPSHSLKWNSIIFIEWTFVSMMDFSSNMVWINSLEACMVAFSVWTCMQTHKHAKSFQALLHGAHTLLLTHAHSELMLMCTGAVFGEVAFALSSVTL